MLTATADDQRVMRRDEAEVGQEDGSREPIYRIEYRTAQDLHSMARNVQRQGPLVRSTPLPGGATKSGYLRARVSNPTAPGFPDKAGKVAPAAPVEDRDSMSSLMGSYRPPPKKDKEAMYAAPTDIRRSGPDYAAPAPRPPIPSTSSSAAKPAAPIARPQPPVASRPPAAAIPPPPARTTFIRSRGSSPTPVCYDPPPGGVLHPLALVRPQPPLSSYNFQPFSPVVLRPGTYKIFLIIDTREMGGKSSRTEFVEKLREQGVNVDRRMLPLGDMIWVARPQDAFGQLDPNGDVVLDVIVERKRLDDLCTSIIDGRYTSQKVGWI